MAENDTVALDVRGYSAFGGQHAHGAIGLLLVMQRLFPRWQDHRS
jgi:hypothetical protein